jgi:hypothetical protein
MNPPNLKKVEIKTQVKYETQPTENKVSSHLLGSKA